MLNDLIDATTAPVQLFPSRDPVKSARLMATMDRINGPFGRAWCALPFQASSADGPQKQNTCRHAIRRA